MIHPRKSIYCWETPIPTTKIFEKDGREKKKYWSINQESHSPSAYSNASSSSSGRGWLAAWRSSASCLLTHKHRSPCRSKILKRTTKKITVMWMISENSIMSRRWMKSTLTSNRIHNVLTYRAFKQITNDTNSFTVHQHFLRNLQMMDSTTTPIKK